MPHECGMNVGIDPNAIRTHDLPLRRRMLYPAELRDRNNKTIIAKCHKDCKLLLPR